ncbi:MAG: hypothetical protein MZU79_00575, partial [Anaerotruncus sp.]|nr:hypothetical protein [Anaerotruncus sp.]
YAPRSDACVLLRLTQGTPTTFFSTSRRPRPRRGRVYCFGPDVPRREVEDPAAPHRVLDGGARGGVRTTPTTTCALQEEFVSLPRGSARSSGCQEELQGARARHRRSSRT